VGSLNPSFKPSLFNMVISAEKRDTVRNAENNMPNNFFKTDSMRNRNVRPHPERYRFLFGKIE